jgi:hypothetical protein
MSKIRKNVSRDMFICSSSREEARGRAASGDPRALMIETALDLLAARRRLGGRLRR